MNKRKVIALLINDAGLADYYQGGLRRGAEQICIEEDIDLRVYGGHMDWTPSGVAQRQIFELLEATRVDGIVLAAGCISAFVPLDEVLETLRARGAIPTCAIGQSCAGLSNVVIDNVGGAARAVDHLVEEHGRRRLLYIAGPPNHEESEQRLRGTREAAARHGISLGSDAVQHGDFSAGSAGEIVRAQLRQGVDFDCIVAANDDMALAAIEALEQAGLSCPEQVAVIGFDDSSAARFHEPSLTSVRQPVPLLGSAAVRQLQKLWNGKVVPEVLTLETELIVRQSCGCQEAALAVSTRGRAHPYDPPGAPELTRQLVPVIDGQAQRTSAARELWSAVEAELAGEVGALRRAFQALLSRELHPHAQVGELQRVISTLRSRALQRGPNAALEDAFHVVRNLVATETARRSERRHFEASWILREIQLSSERLSTALSLPALKQALLEQLARLRIRKALISLYPRGEKSTLEPLVCVEEGVEVSTSGGPYPAALLIPDGLFRGENRSSLTVLPLTFEAEQLGVAILDVPMVGLYTLLREQIGSALKTVQLHRDMVERERSHARLQEEKRATNERLKSLSLIAGGVAHDLNNVLGPLLAFPDTIQRELARQLPNGIPEAVLEDLSAIAEAGHSAALTIRDLVALGGTKELPQSSLDLNKVLERERRTLFAICEGAKTITFEILPTQPLPAIRASRPHLVRAISNLVINSVNAIASAGKITLRTSFCALSRRLEGSEPIEPGHYVVVEVEDTGVGIAEQHLPHILEPFFTTKHDRATPGGLGLAIVHRIVKDSLGYVRVESEVGRGTKIRLYFPAQDGETKHDSNYPARTPPPRSGRGSILVVDDDRMQLKTARRVLEQLGYSVTTCHSGEDAVHLFARSHLTQVFDLAIVDMLMPGALNGIDTIDQLQRLRPAQKALIASGYAPAQMDALARARGLAWLAKPYTVAALAAAVRDAIAA